MLSLYLVIGNLMRNRSLSTYAGQGWRYGTVSGPSHANKNETSLISTEMDHACLPRSSELCEPRLTVLDYMWIRQKEAGGIHPGSTYNTRLPARLCQGLSAPTTLLKIERWQPPTSKSPGISIKQLKTTTWFISLQDLHHGCKHGVKDGIE